MEKRLYALGTAPCVDEPTAIELLAASGKRQEVHLAAARIRRLAAMGEDVSQMAVVYPKQSGYGALLQNILPMYGLATYVAEKRKAGAHPLSRFILSALAAISAGWRLSDWRRRRWIASARIAKGRMCAARPCASRFAIPRA